MKTLVVHTNGLKETELDTCLEPAVKALLDSQPVGIPTETVYGLGANAFDQVACQRIFETKNRPSDNPLIVHISSLEMLHLLVRRSSDYSNDDDTHKVFNGLAIPESIIPVLLNFWPGPLTVLLPKNEDISDVVTAGLDTVAVRFPAHPVARRIIELSGCPLAAPSANLSGRPSPTTSQHVLDDLEGRVSVVVDGGSCDFGLESTVLDATRNPPVILRPGSITANMLKAYLPDVRIFKKTSDNISAEEAKKMEERPSTPGMKYRHYSPTSPLILFDIPFSLSTEDHFEHVESVINAFVKDELNQDHRVARLTIKQSRQNVIVDDHYFEFCLSENGNHEEIARNLFAGLRAADAIQPHLIVAQSVPDDDEGLAIMNRISKAASFTRIITLPPDEKKLTN